MVPQPEEVQDPARRSVHAETWTAMPVQPECFHDIGVFSTASEGEKAALHKPQVIASHFKRENCAVEKFLKVHFLLKEQFGSSLSYPGLNKCQLPDDCQGLRMCAHLPTVK